MTPGSSGGCPTLDELAAVVGDLRGLVRALIASEAALLDARRKLEDALVEGDDSGAILAELEQEAKHYAAALDAIRELAPVVRRLLDDDQKYPPEPSAGLRAQANA